MAEKTRDFRAKPTEDDAFVPKPQDVTFETHKLADLAVTAAVFATGAFIVAEASTFRAGSFPDPVTARGLPYFTGSFMMLGAVVTGIRQMLTWNRFPGSYTLTIGSPDESGQPASALRAFSMVALALCFVLLLRPLGFLIVTPAIIFAMLLVMNVRTPGKLIAFPIGFTATIWIAFSQLLGIVLPLGPLMAMARSWGLVP